MLAKSNRFSFKNKLPKNTLNSKSFTLRYEKNDEGLKAAVVVSRKVDKSAVVRNSLKRKIVTSLETKQDEKLNLVFYLKKVAASENLSQEVEQALDQIRN